MMAKVSVDFETEAIGTRADGTYPPRPVGVAIQVAGREPVYLAWGHHGGGNNISEADARDRLLRHWHVDQLVFHNAKFDLEVAEAAWGFTEPDRWEDTLILAFLLDPHRRQLGLKALAHQILSQPPDEETALNAWLKEHIPQVKRRPSSAGAYIAAAPGNVVRPYAKGDASRTLALYQELRPALDADPYLPAAYEREKRLIPVLQQMERNGIKIAERRLKKDLKHWYANQNDINQEIYDRLGVPYEERETFPFTGDRFADALEEAGLVEEWELTDKGNRRTAFDSLQRVCTDQEFAELLHVRAQLATCVTTFAEPWLQQCRLSGTSMTYTTFHGTRSDRGGARTGRISSSPNYQNLIRGDKPDDRVPRLREYVISGRGYRMTARDYSQQELRILAHYERSTLLDRYHDEPDLDAHDEVRDLLCQAMGIHRSALPRKPVKNINFGILYGLGDRTLSDKLDMDLRDTRQLRQAYYRALPGVNELQRRLKLSAAQGKPIYTWGGRRYYCEPPRWIDGKLRSFDYKLLNYLVQGSAADCTKEAMIRAFEDGLGEHLILQVHDEILAVAPSKQLKEVDRALQVAMESVEFDVPMLTDNKTGTNWGLLS